VFAKPVQRGPRRCLLTITIRRVSSPVFSQRMMTSSSTRALTATSSSSIHGKSCPSPLAKRGSTRAYRDKYVGRSESMYAWLVDTQVVILGKGTVWLASPCAPPMRIWVQVDRSRLRWASRLGRSAMISFRTRKSLELSRRERHTDTFFLFTVPDS
jgi:hypothetical protein